VGLVSLALAGAAVAQDRAGNGEVRLQRKALPSGSLRERLPRQIGRFALVDAAAYPEALANGATDGLQARFRADDGAEVTVYLMAFSSPRGSAETFGALTQSLLEEDYVKKGEGDVVDEGGKPRGLVMILERERGTVVWTNGNLLIAAESAEGSSWEFARAYPD
jgi:hypothetical protein